MFFEPPHSLKGMSKVRRKGFFLKTASVAAIGALAMGLSPAAVAEETTPPEQDSAQVSTTDISSGDTTGAASEPVSVENEAKEKTSPIQKDTLGVQELGEGRFQVSFSTAQRSAGGEFGVDPVTVKRHDPDRSGINVSRAEVNGETLDTAYASAETLDKDFDLVSFDLYEATTAEADQVSFIYQTDQADPAVELKAWELVTDEELNAFAEGKAISEEDEADSLPQPRIAAYRAAAQPADRPQLDPVNKSIQLVGPYPGSETGMNNGEYTGPLNDPDFGLAYEQNPPEGDYTYRAKTYTYPIRHRNWGAAGYDRCEDRQLRGPHKGLVSGGGNDTPTCHENEQGYFFSRDHVQYAWKGDGNASNPPVYRGDEFLIGGGNPNGVWYGGTYTAPTNTSIDWGEKYRGSGVPGFKLFVDGVLNTDDPGWRKVKSGTGFNFISPKSELLIRIEERNGGKGMEYMFFDYKQLQKDGLINDKNNFINFENQKDVLMRHRVGLSTPNWTRVFLGYGSSSGKDANGNIASVNSMNGYLSSQFVPEFDPGNNGQPTISKKVLPASSGASWGEDSNGKYIDYEIKVVAPSSGSAQYWYKLDEAPDFGPNIEVTGLTLEDMSKALVKPYSKSDYALRKTSTSTGNPSYQLTQNAKRSTPAKAPELGVHDYIELSKGDVHTFKFRARFKSATEKEVATSGECKAGNGLYNKASLDVYKATEKRSAEACAHFEKEPEPGKLDIRKQVKPATSTSAWGRDSQGYYVDYDISVKSPAEPSNGIYWYKIKETPNFDPNIKVKDLSVLNVDGKSKDDFGVSKSTNSDGKQTFEIAQKNARTSSNAPQLGTHNYLEIWANQTHTVTVRVHFEPQKGTKIESDDQCSAGEGLFNSAALSIPGQSNGPSDQACTKYNQEGDNATLGLVKLDQNGQHISVDKQFEFAIFDEEGNRIGLDRSEKATEGNFIVKGTQAGALKIGKKYFLVETKAPTGYELLAEPVPFTVDYDPQGKPTLTIENEEAHPQIVGKSDVGYDMGVNAVYFAVSDIRKGDLPKSGGSGVLGMLGAGLLLVLLAGGYCIRRRG